MGQHCQKAVVVVSAAEGTSEWRMTNQAICQITDDRHQELLEVRDLGLTDRGSSAMHDFVKSIEQTND